MAIRALDIPDGTLEAVEELASLTGVQGRAAPSARRARRTAYLRVDHFSAGPRESRRGSRSR